MSQVSLACPLPFPPCLALPFSPGPSGNILLPLRSSSAKIGYSSLDHLRSDFFAKVVYFRVLDTHSIVLCLRKNLMSSVVLNSREMHRNQSQVTLYTVFVRVYTQFDTLPPPYYPARMRKG